MILLDTSALVAALFPDQRAHEDCAMALHEADAPRILSPFVLAEVGYLIRKMAGVDAEIAFLDEAGRGVYELVPFTAADVANARRIVAKYRSLRIGLTDASVAVLAAKYNVFDVLTLDERHFRAIRPAPRKRFRILPADA